MPSRSLFCLLDYESNRHSGKPTKTVLVTSIPMSVLQNTKATIWLVSTSISVLFLVYHMKRLQSQFVSQLLNTSLKTLHFFTDILLWSLLFSFVKLLNDFYYLNVVFNN